MRSCTCLYIIFISTCFISIYAQPWTSKFGPSIAGLYNQAGLYQISHFNDSCDVELKRAENDFKNHIIGFSFSINDSLPVKRSMENSTVPLKTYYGDYQGCYNRLMAHYIANELDSNAARSYTTLLADYYTPFFADKLMDALHKHFKGTDHFSWGNYRDTLNGAGFIGLLFTFDENGYLLLNEDYLYEKYSYRAYKRSAPKKTSDDPFYEETYKIHTAMLNPSHRLELIEAFKNFRFSKPPGSRVLNAFHIYIAYYKNKKSAS